MATEAIRGLIRIASNYTRLLFTLTVGLVIVPLQLRWYGLDAFGLISVVSGTVGLSAMLDEMMRLSMIRELGTAYHSRDNARFLRVFNSALVLSFIVAVACGLLLTVMGLLLTSFAKITPELQRGAIIMLASEGICWMAFILLSPINNMYVIQERWIEDNLWLILRRGNHLIAIFFVRYGLGVTDPIRGFELFSMIAPGLGMFVLAIAVIRMVAGDRRLIPRPSLASRAELRVITGTYGFNGATTLTYALYEYAPRFIINGFFGLAANAIYGAAFQITSYMRMVSTGMNTGLDAVSARVSSGRSTTSLVELNRHSTRLHAVSVMPCVAILAILLEPLLMLWIGGRGDLPPDAIPRVYLMGLIFIPQIAIRSISDAWIRILYGAGFVRRYALLLLIGGALSPVITILLILAVPDRVGLYIPSIVLAVVYSCFHFVVLPIVAARCLNVSVGQVMRPIIRPAIAALLGVPILLASRWAYEHWSAWMLLAGMVAYGLVYFVLVWFIVLDKHERKRFSAAFSRRLQAKLPFARNNGAVPAEVLAAQREQRLEADEIVNP